MQALAYLSETTCHNGALIVLEVKALLVPTEAAKA